MNLLLDTHAFIWWVTDNTRLPEAARAVIADRGNDVLVSAVSAMEVTTKHRIGKLPGIGRLATSFEAEVTASGFSALPINMRHAETAGRLEIAHKDPFDRLLIAQALVDDLVLVSNETLFDTVGARRIW